VRRRPQLFTLMLAAFALAIVLSVGGMFGLYALAVPHTAEQGVPLPDKLGSLRGMPEWPYAPTDPEAGGGDRFRGFLSAALAMAAVLLGLATFFSSRVSRPLGRLTQAARTMASGDLSVRVGNFGIREVNELGEAFNSMAASISEADRQRRQLTADVAHELRTPLSIIRGRLEGLQDGVYSANPEQLSILLDETSQLERLIEDLRLLALADAGQLPLYHTHVHPIQLLRDVERSFSQQAAECGVSLKVSKCEGLPEMRADPQRLAQVLDNLVMNALRYTPAGGTVEVRAWTDGRNGTAPYVDFAVADTGIGIAAEEVPYIFDRFYRADRARSRSSGGAGLGLAISKRIVEAHGGQIWAQSAPGEGTTVVCRLPVEIVA
jgi:signal transduction histidine kinase